MTVKGFTTSSLFIKHMKAKDGFLPKPIRIIYMRNNKGEYMLHYSIDLSSYSIEQLRKLLADQVITVFELHYELKSRDAGEYLVDMCG